jgi:putative ubiquitin-RnfH superfamily antitoxin RatB of RatAB toxin-antitoxin module
MANKPDIQVTVLYSPAARQTCEMTVTVAHSCTVFQALERSGLLKNHPEIGQFTLRLGLWGRKVSCHHTLRDQDRVEVYRVLRVDPKVARRERFIKQGARSAGLFMKKRAATKTGY